MENKYYKGKFVEQSHLLYKRQQINLNPYFGFTIKPPHTNKIPEMIRTSFEKEYPLFYP